MDQDNHPHNRSKGQAQRELQQRNQLLTAAKTNSKGLGKKGGTKSSKPKIKSSKQINSQT